MAGAGSGCGKGDVPQNRQSRGTRFRVLSAIFGLLSWRCRLWGHRPRGEACFPWLALQHQPQPSSPSPNPPPNLIPHRYAVIEAARAVAFALAPGLPPVEHVTIRPRGNTVARILFVPQASAVVSGGGHCTGGQQRRRGRPAGRLAASTTPPAHTTRMII